jgi:putative transcription factor
MPIRCEICGSLIHGSGQAVEIDGALMTVCNSCERLGTPVKTSRDTASHPPTGAAKSKGIELEEADLEVTQDYNSMIRKAREKMGLSQEELGRRLNEKPSVIRNLEIGKLKPEHVLARKLEHFLKIQLLTAADES